MIKLSVRRISGESHGAQSGRLNWSSRSGLLLELSTQSSRGLGEASPLPGFSPDSLENVERALRELDLSALERALGDRDIRDALRATKNLLPRSLPSARMALETAVLDLRGRQCGVSAPELLGAALHSEHALAWLAGLPDASSLAASRKAQEAGYRHFKLKLGRAGHFERELAGVSEFRQVLGPEPRIRLDANGAWSETETRLACRALEGFDIELIEEPCGHLGCSVQTSIPIALDESLRGLDCDGLEDLARRTSARFAILKPMVLGGLSHCLDLAERAHDLGVGIVVSHSFDGPLALSAAGALALALAGDTAHGLAPHAGLAAWPKVPLPIRGAALRAWASPGLGAVSESLD